MKPPIFLNNLDLDADGIYSFSFKYQNQDNEVKLRKSILKNKNINYLQEVSCHHSIPVMDVEIRKFVNLLPQNSIILDMGGCWGWHWRNINHFRPDLKIVILDFIRENLMHAKNLLKDKINKSIFLVYGDGKDLEFKDNVFDGYWSVQTTQHIPNLEKVYKEAYRVLKFNGIFSDYSYNNSVFVKFIFNIFKKDYVINDQVKDQFFLRRASKLNYSILKKIFKCKIREKYSEVLFFPELKLPLGSSETSLIGKIDSYLSSSNILSKIFARQHSFHIFKR